MGVRHFSEDGAIVKRYENVTGYVEVMRSNGALALVTPKAVIVGDDGAVTIESPLREYLFLMLETYSYEECDVIRERWVVVTNHSVVITSLIGTQVQTCIARHSP